MPMMIVTPPRTPVVGYGQARVLRFPSVADWPELEDKVAMAKAPNQIGPPDLADRFARFQAGEDVDLTDGASIRIGASFALILNGQPIFGSFDEGHRTRAKHLTPAAGRHLKGLPFRTGVVELSQEMIPIRDGAVGVWQVEDLPIYAERSEQYATDHGLSFDPGLIVPVKLAVSDLHILVGFGDICQPALVECEADTSSLEIIYVGIANYDGLTVVDGERLDFLPESPWRGTPTINDNYGEHPLTTKAQIVLRAHETGIRLPR